MSEHTPGPGDAWRLYEDAINRIRQLEVHRAESIRLRGLLAQVAQEIALSDLSPALRHAIEAEIQRQE